MSEVEVADPADDCINDPKRVYFRAGLLAARESIARALANQLPSSGLSGVVAAAEIARGVWWEQLGEDPGAPRKLRWDELTTEVPNAEDADDPKYEINEALTPSVEALPYALGFLEDPSCKVIQVKD